MITMKGPTKRLERLGTQVEAAGRVLPDRISRAVERQVLPLIEEGYRSRTDPYGQSWAQPKAGNKPMEITGKLRKAYEVIRVISGLRWTIYASNNARAKSGGAFYGNILQYGFRHKGGSIVEPRRQVPITQRLSQRWAQRMQDAAKREGVAWAQGVGK
jgi:hypothetical protein